MLWQQQYVLRSVVQTDSVTSCRCRACEPFYARKFIAKNWVVKYFSYAQRWKHAQRRAKKNKRTKFFSIFWSRRKLLCGCTVQANSRFHFTFFMQKQNSVFVKFMFGFWREHLYYFTRILYQVPSTENDSPSWCVRVYAYKSLTWQKRKKSLPLSPPINNQKPENSSSPPVESCE